MFKSILNFGQSILGAKTLLLILLGIGLSVGIYVRHLTSENARLGKLTVSLTGQLNDYRVEVNRLTKRCADESDSCFAYQKKLLEVTAEYNGILAEIDTLLPDNIIVNKPSVDNTESPKGPVHVQDTDTRFSDAARIVLCKSNLAKDGLCNDTR